MRIHDTRAFMLRLNPSIGIYEATPDYIHALEVFATYGYVVVAPFHGDAGCR